ncbi:MAG: hypothetical protein ACK5TK_12750 [Betaproteobacteria bacterium]
MAQPRAVAEDRQIGDGAHRAEVGLALDRTEDEGQCERGGEHQMGRAGKLGRVHGCEFLTLRTAEAGSRGLSLLSTSFRAQRGISAQRKPGFLAFGTQR